MRAGEGGGANTATQLPVTKSGVVATACFQDDKPSAVSLPTRSALQPPRVAVRGLEAPLVPSATTQSGVGSAWLQSLVPQQVVDGTVPPFLHTIAGDIEAAKNFWM